MRFIIHIRLRVNTLSILSRSRNPNVGVSPSVCFSDFFLFIIAREIRIEISHEFFYLRVFSGEAHVNAEKK